MADLLKLTIFPGEIATLTELPTTVTLLNGYGELVVNEAIVHASGPNHPRIRSGEMVSHIHKEDGIDEKGAFVDVGSDVVSPRKDYHYASKLETGEDGLFYPWLVPAFKQIFPDAIENPEG